MTAGRIILPCMPALDGGGQPVGGALLHFHDNATAARKPIYSNPALTEWLANPVAADAEGVFPPIYADVEDLYLATCFSPGGVMLPGAAYSNVRAVRAAPGPDGAARVGAQALMAVTSGRRPLVAFDDDYGPSLKQTYGAVGDGVFDDTPAVQAANAAGGLVYVPAGAYKTTLGFYDPVNVRTIGPGQIILGGYKQARERSFLTTEISDASNDRTQIFNQDYSKASVVRYAFRGGALGQNPITSYRNLTAATPELRILDFSGGTNTGVGDHATGRTGMADQRDSMYHGGQGDLVWRTFHGEVYSARAGATHFLANPAIAIDNGGFGASGLATGAYLQHSEFIFNDGGLSVAAGDRVRNYFRYNGNRDLNQAWFHDRIQVAGPVPLDVAYSPAGMIRRGFDIAAASFEDGAAIVLKDGNYVYWDATSTPDSLGVTFYSDDLGDTFDGMIGDTRQITIGVGKHMRIAGLGVYPNDAAAATAGVPLNCLYRNSTTGAITERQV